MKTKKRTMIFASLALLLALFTVGGVLAASNASVMERWVLASGGSTASAGNISLSDTLGQPVTGVSGGGVVDMQAGYWNSAAYYTIYMPLARK